jgi:acyl-CoA synthetase (AMP-forming)/AMP-acid ligase II
MTPSLFDHIRFQAQLRPNALAVYGPAGPVAYHGLVRDTEALATELLERNLSRQDMVGIRLGSTYLNLVLILALDRLSIPAMSFAPGDALPPPAAVQQQLGVTAIVSAQAAPTEPPCRWIAMAEQHRPRFGAIDAVRLARLDSPAESLIYVGWSSGTTGGAKGVPISRSIQASRLDARRVARHLGPRTRLYTGVPFSSAPGYIMPLAVLSAGGAIILPNPETDFVTLANLLGVTTMNAAPSMLADLVGKPDAAPRRLDSMEMLVVSGTQLSGQLAREVRLELTPHIWVAYGSTETDAVAEANAAVAHDDPCAVGFLLPWIDAQIVDETDRPLPAGQEGRLRLRSAQTVAGYYGNPAATQRNFRDSWFYPGDIAIVTPHRLLRVIGRVEDVITRDGVTISPLPIEEAIGGLPQVRDVAAFPMPGAGGTREIWAAIVLAPGSDAKAVAAAVAARLGNRTVARLFLVDRVPRNANGKILRRTLVAWAEQGEKR